MNCWFPFYQPQETLVYGNKYEYRDQTGSLVGITPGLYRPAYPHWPMELHVNILLFNNKRQDNMSYDCLLDSGYGGYGSAHGSIKLKKGVDTYKNYDPLGINYHTAKKILTCTFYNATMS
jgi:hypothetical protein